MSEYTHKIDNREYKQTKIANLEESGVYTKKLIDCLKHGQIDEIGRLPLEERSKKDYILPVLYAVRNEYKSYRVYTYLSPSLQSDETLALEVIENEPALIAGTPLAADKNFILSNISKYPEIAQYMDDTLYVYPSIQKAINPEEYEKNKKIALATMEVTAAVVAYPYLANDEEYMKQAISKDVNALELLGDELKDNSEFLKEIFSKNKEAISYTANNMDKFGINGLIVAKDVATVDVLSDAAKEFRTKAEEIKSKNEGKAENEITEEDRIEQARAERHSQSMEDDMMKAQNGDEKIIRKFRRILCVCKNLSPEYRERMEEVVKLADGVLERKKEQGQISLQDIEEVANAPIIDTITALNETAKELASALATKNKNTREEERT